MNTDAELLRRFVEDGSEAAFTELVQRHLALVRGTALRRVGGDAHAADDVTQQVFVALARKAPGLRGHATLAGWLYLSTHHATADWVRREQRRRRREAVAHSMQLNESPADPSADATRLRPLLDDALVTLKPDEREAIVLRFFSGRTFAEIGATFALSEEAARKRVDRALEKLQGTLVRRGVTSTVAALGGALTAAGMEPVSVGLAGQVAGIALAKAAAPGLVATLTSAFWPAATAAALAGGMVAIVAQHDANAKADAALAARESATRAAIASIQTENRLAERDLTAIRSAAREREQAVAARTAATPVSPTAVQKTTPEGVRISVSPAGALRWGDTDVTLDEFLEQLVSYQGSAPAGESRMVIDARSARFRQLNWVLDEVRKVGVAHLIVDSDAPPEGPMNTWF